jgi:hypothetical protein
MEQGRNTSFYINAVNVPLGTLLMLNTYRCNLHDPTAECVSVLIFFLEEPYRLLLGVPPFLHP